MSTEKPLVDDAILFSIDMLNDFLLPGEEFVIDEGRNLYPGMQTLLAFAREHGIPIVHGASQDMNNSKIERFWPAIADRSSCQGGTPGVEVVNELKPDRFSDAEVYLPKRKYSMFYGTPLEIILRNPPFLGRNTIIVTGMATAGCCLATAMDAFNRDYDVLMIDDLCCTVVGAGGVPAHEMHRGAIRVFETAYGEAITLDELIARLEGAPAAVGAAAAAAG